MARMKWNKNKKSIWVSVKDAHLRAVWICRKCKDSAEVFVDVNFYEKNGTPICSECDNDLRYVRTDLLFAID